MKALNSLLLALALLASAGCATGNKLCPWDRASGPMFSPAENILEAKALVYIYRMSHIGGIARAHRLYANGTPVASLANASYYPFVTSPGTLQFSSNSRTANPLIDPAISSDSLLTLEVKTGATYFLEFHIGDTWGPKLLLVDPQTGLNRIQKCRLAETFVKKG